MKETFIKCLVCATARDESWSLEETNKVLKEEADALDLDISQLSQEEFDDYMKELDELSHMLNDVFGDLTLDGDETNDL